MCEVREWHNSHYWIVHHFSSYLCDLQEKWYQNFRQLDCRRRNFQLFLVNEFHVRRNILQYRGYLQWTSFFSLISDKLNEISKLKSIRISVSWILWLHSIFLFWINANMLNLIRKEIRMFFKFNPKNQNYIFEMRVAIKTYPNILNSIIMYTLCSLDQKYYFGKNWFQKIKIFCLRWNTEPTILDNSLEFYNILEEFPFKTSKGILDI